MRFVLCLAAAVTVGHAQEYSTHYVMQRAEFLQKKGIVTSEWEDDKAARWLVMVDTWTPSPDKREEQMKERLTLASMYYAGGELKKGWMDKHKSVCEWEDVECNADNSIIHIRKKYSRQYDDDDGNDIPSSLNTSDFYYEGKSYCIDG